MDSKQDGAELYKKCQVVEGFLNHEVIAELFSAVETQYVDAWMRATDPVAREHAWAMVQALHDLHKGMRILAEKKQAWDEAEKRREERAARFNLDSSTQGG